MRDKAASSFFALVVLLGLCIVAYAALAKVAEFKGLRSRLDALALERALCDEAVEAWEKGYIAGAGEVDSPFEKTAQFTAPPGLSFEIEDISSRLNANWGSISLLGQPYLKGLFQSGADSTKLTAIRESLGPSSDPASFAAVFTPEALEKTITVYGYADANTSDAKELARLFFKRSGAEPSDSFLNRIREENRISHAITTSELKLLLSPNFKAVYPLIDVAPPLNANYAPSSVLRAILAYPPYGIKDPDSRLSLIETARSAGRIDRDRLIALVGAARENPVYHYLGVRTWFWRITVEAPHTRLSAIIARLPPDPDHELEDQSSPRLVLLERSFEK